METALFYEKNTIVALATASGKGALAIVRASGSQCDQILEKCFSKSKSPQETFESHHVYFGIWKDPINSRVLDEVVVLYFGEGRGFTGEKSIEIICHGGSAAVELITESLLSAGARMAKPGEFTFRAVMNGKMDLIQAESILDIIEARSEKAVTTSVANLRGALSKDLKKIESDIVFLLANLEAAIDFTTEDIQPVDNREMAKKGRQVLSELERVLKSYIYGRVIQSGVRVAIVGKPNAGKSSLLNALIGEERAIVTEIAGTTRDTIEVEREISGIVYRFIDTAGLRETSDLVESIGVKRAAEAMEKADVVLYVVDATRGFEKEEIDQIAKLGSRRCHLVFNKTDLVDWDILSKKVELELHEARLTGYSWAALSIKTRAGFEALDQALKKLVKLDELEEDRAILSNLRQKEALEQCREGLLKSIELMERNESPEFISQELAIAHHEIEDALGKAVREDVMDRVFKEFCIGK